MVNQYNAANPASLANVGEVLPPECRFCALLKQVEHPLRGEERNYRCSAGRYDEPSPSGGTIPRSCAWSGIWRPCLFAEAAQKNYTEFKIHPHVESIGKTRPPRRTE